MAKNLHGHLAFTQQFADENRDQILCFQRVSRYFRLEKLLEALLQNIQEIRCQTPHVHAAHHGEVCEDLSSTGSYRSPCFVYNFFRNIYFFFMGSDPKMKSTLLTVPDPRDHIYSFLLLCLINSFFGIFEKTQLQIEHFLEHLAKWHCFFSMSSKSYSLREIHNQLGPQKRYTPNN